MARTRGETGTSARASFVRRVLAGVRADVLVAVLLALPTFLVRMPPMVDFPAHETVVGVLRSWSDPSFYGGTLYRLNLGHPNQLQYWLALPVAYVLGPTKGLECTVAVAIASILTGAGRLAEHLGRPRWIALCAAPIAIGWNYQWGHIANLLGIGALLWALPRLDRFVRAPTRAGVLRACGWMVLLYFAHEVSVVVACVAIVLFALRPFDAKRAAMSAIPCAFAVVIVVLQLTLQKLSILNQDFYLVPVPLLARLSLVPTVIVGYLDSVVGLAAFALYALPLVVAVGLRLQRAAPRPEPTSPGAPYAVLALLLVAAYCTLPVSYGGVFYFSHRFLPIAWPILAVVVFAGGREPPRALRLVVYTLPVGVLLTYWPMFLASDAVYRELDGVLPALSSGSAVVGIELDPVKRGAMAQAGYSTRDAHGHVVAWKGGRSLHDYTQSPISPALLSPERRWEAITDDTFLDPVAIRPLAALTHFRYLLLHSRLPDMHRAARRALAGVASPVAMTGEWSVFESRILAVEPAAPEGRYPEAAGPTLRQMIGHALAADAPRP